MFIRVLIAGVKFRDIEAQVRANRLEPGEDLVLIPEPTNRFDPHAVKVLTPNAIFLGYVPRTHSQRVAEAIHNGTYLWCGAGVLPLEIKIELAESTDANEPTK